MILRTMTAVLGIGIGLACAQLAQGPTGPGNDPPPAGGIQDGQSVTPKQYLDYLFPILQKEPPVAVPVVFSAVRPVTTEDLWLREMVRVCRTIRVDVWASAEDWRRCNWPILFDGPAA